MCTVQMYLLYINIYMYKNMWNFFLGLGYLGRLESDSDRYTCPVCGNISESLRFYLEHTSSVHSAYMCHECHKSFSTKCSMLRHRPIHHGIQRYSCSACAKTFYRLDKGNIYSYS